MLTPAERRALTLTVFTAACVTFAPAEVVSGVVLLIAAGLLHRWDQTLLDREEAAKEAAKPPPTEPEAEAPGRAEASG